MIRSFVAAILAMAVYPALAQDIDAEYGACLAHKHVVSGAPSTQYDAGYESCPVTEKAWRDGAADRAQHQVEAAQRRREFLERKFQSLKTGSNR